MVIRIFIDQGHNPGPINAGASVNGLQEQQVVYNVGIYLAQLLDEDPRFAVRTSRQFPEQVIGIDQTSSLRQRVQMANAWPADYFISIHANANVNPAINGTEVYVYQRNSVAFSMAQDVLEGIVEYVGTRDNFVRINPSLYVLRATTMPAQLVELAYLTNPGDFEKLQNDQYNFAYGMYMGILRYFGFRDSIM